jgi:hypothetical protein
MYVLHCQVNGERRDVVIPTESEPSHAVLAVQRDQLPHNGSTGRVGVYRAEYLHQWARCRV